MQATTETSAAVNGTKPSRRARIAGLRPILEQECVDNFAPGRPFTSVEALALVAHRFPGQRLSRRDMNNALYRSATDPHGKLAQAGGQRSGAYVVRATAASAAVADGTRPLGALIDQMLTLLTEVAERVAHVEQVEARLKALGIRIEAQP